MKEKRPEFDTSGTATDDNHMKKTVCLFGSLTRESGGLDTYWSEFSKLQCPVLFLHTVKETVLHLHDLSAQGIWQWQSPSKIPHLLSILELFHEAGVLLDSRNAERLGLGTDTVDKIVVRYSRCANSTLDIRGITEGDGFVYAL